MIIWTLLLRWNYFIKLFFLIIVHFSCDNAGYKKKICFIVYEWTKQLFKNNKLFVYLNLSLYK